MYHNLKIFWDYSLHFHKWTYLHHGPWCNRHVSASRHGVRTLHWNNVIILNAYQRIRKRPVTNLKRSDLQGVPEKLCFIFSSPQPIPREHILYYKYNPLMFAWFFRPFTWNNAIKSVGCQSLTKHCFHPTILLQP